MFEAVAEVMHAGVTEPDRCGVRFQDLDQMSLFAVHSYVAEQTKQ